MSFNSFSPTCATHSRNFETELRGNAVNAMECIKILDLVKKRRRIPCVGEFDNKMHHPGEIQSSSKLRNIPKS
jgi:hypothetical protein